MKTRILSLDVFRGLMLFCMCFDHLVCFPFIHMNGLYSFTVQAVYGPFGFLSNSEGFFFLSGLVSGIVYGKLVLTDRIRELWPRILRRVTQMYLCHIILFAAVALLLFFSNQYQSSWRNLHDLIGVWKGQPGIHYCIDHPFSAFGLGCLFLYLPPFFDILPVFMLFLLITPFVLRKLQAGKVVFVLLGSITLWALAQFFDLPPLEKALLSFLPVKLGWFHPLALQLLFVSGLTLGFFHAKGSLISTQRIFLWGALFLSSALIFSYLTGREIGNIHHLGILRLTIFAIKASCAFLLHRFFTLWPVALLGKNSLLVFTYHMALVYALVFFLPHIGALPYPLQSTLLISSTFSLWLPVYLKERKGSLVYAK